MGDGFGLVVGQKNKFILEKFRSANNPEQKEREEEVCLICYENPCQVVLMPCKHGGICMRCGEDLIVRRKKRECYLCRKKIKMVLRVEEAGKMREVVGCSRV